MATRSSLAARSGAASAQSDQAMARIAAQLKIDPPPPTPLARDFDARTALQQERTARFLESVVKALGGKPVDAAPEAKAAKPEEEAQAESSGDEPVFGHDNLPLSHFDGMGDQEILDLPGIGKTTLQKIRDAQFERDANG